MEQVHLVDVEVFSNDTCVYLCTWCCKINIAIIRFKDDKQTFEVNGEATEASACDNEIPACATLRALKKCIPHISIMSTINGTFLPLEKVQ